jgi:hypothetical protein
MPVQSSEWSWALSYFKSMCRHLGGGLHGAHLTSHPLFTLKKGIFDMTVHALSMNKEEEDE